MGGVFEKVYCAFCRLERGVCRKRHVNWTNVVLCAFSTAVVMFLIWNRIEPKAVILFAISLMFAEVFVHLRWRLTLTCPHCHFDPALYKRNPALASLHVKKRLDGLRQSGEHLLKVNNPFQHLPTITPENLEEKRPSSQILSRHV